MELRSHRNDTVALIYAVWSNLNWAAADVGRAFSVYDCSAWLTSVFVFIVPSALLISVGDTRSIGLLKLLMNM